jgi:hypothetical protein
VYEDLNDLYKKTHLAKVSKLFKILGLPMKLLNYKETPEIILDKSAEIPIK